MKAINKILRVYGIINYKIEKIKQLDLISKVWIVDCKAQKFILKVHPNYFNEVDLKFIKNFEQNLLKQAFKCPKTIPTSTGDLWVCNNKNIYTLTEYIEGVTLDTSNIDQIKSAGKMLGTLHNESREIDFSTKRDWWTIDSYKYSDYVNEINIKSNNNFDDFLKIINKSWLQINKLIIENNKYQNEKKIIIHGDYRIPNIINSTRGLYLIDFDSCRYEIPEMDFSKSLRHICNINNSTDWKNKVREFIKSYLCQSSSNQLIPESLYACLLVQPIKESLWQLRKYLKTKDVINLKIFKREVDFLFYILNNYQLINFFYETI